MRNRHPKFRIERGNIYRGDTRLDVPGIDIIRPIGSGANGVVFSGKQRELDRLVATKVWYKLIDDNSSRAIHEIRKLALLAHPLLVAVHSFGVSKRTPYAIMEFVDGGSLHEWLATDPSTGERKSAWELYSAALKSLYREGERHGDPHTKNVLIYEDKRQLCKSFLSSDTGKLTTIGLKLADTGSSLLWDDRGRFDERESSIIVETLDRVCPNLKPSEAADIPSQLKPDRTLTICDDFADYAMLHESASDRSKTAAFYRVVLGCPFIRLEALIQHAQNVLSISKVEWVLRHALCDAWYCLKATEVEVPFFQRDDSHAPLSNAEFAWMQVVLEKYKFEFLKNPNIEENIPEDSVFSMGTWS